MNSKSRWDIRNGAYEQMFEFINWQARHYGEEKWKNLCDKFMKREVHKSALKTIEGDKHGN